MYSEPTRAESAPFRAGIKILKGRIQRLAADGWLRVDEDLAAMLIHATARGAVLTWLSQPEDRRDPALLTTMRESMVAAVTNEKPAVQTGGPAAPPAPCARRCPNRRRSAALSSTCCGSGWGASPRTAEARHHVHPMRWPQLVPAGVECRQEAVGRSPWAGSDNRVRRKSSSTALKRSGCSAPGRCPAPSMTLTVAYGTSPPIASASVTGV